ncbi:NAD(P)H-dependent flavin oxidoreductase [Paenibacillus agilis]|uniref:Probable nitronate monooxygenase n=1 Tax=Paenibacillus agilis TaxID=3020863 RepID=A0A559J0F9_9BACL|nr:nitronate monooxygenase [Paenibacillus agilis]TVX93323.1 nitronate monooxygenase [Paenibacillus agilis]
MSTQLPQAVAQQLHLPVIVAPMFLISSPKMVIESCKAGLIGSFPLLNARTADELDEWMQHITDALFVAKNKEPEQKIAPWAVNLIVHHSNKRFETDLALIMKHKPPIVITSLGDPQPIVDVVHQYGGLVFSDVSTLKHAQKAAQRGVDGLILVCSGAGGHAGTINPFAFMAEVKKTWQGITILAGSISNGQDILAAKVLGADLAYMGTRFIATTESFAHDDYQTMLIDSTLDDLIYTDAISGVKGNYLIPSIRNAGLDPAKLNKKDNVDFSQLNATNAKAWKNIWSAGQGLGAIQHVATVTLVAEELKQQYKEALDALQMENISKNQN